jgi:hypothetical protein
MQSGLRFAKMDGIPEPLQYEQFCDSKKIEGTGIVDVSTSIIDKKIALVYNEDLAGDGDIDIDSKHAISEKASKLLSGGGLSEWCAAQLPWEHEDGLFGPGPLVRRKADQVKGILGGIDANVNEAFSVSELERRSSSFLATTDMTSSMTNGTQMARLKAKSPAMLVGIDTKNSFNSTWDTDSYWHERISIN